LTGADHGALNLARVEIQMSWVPIPPTRFDEKTTSSPSLRTFGWMSFAAASFKPGFEGRSDYAAIGAVTNLASRLADEATAGQILISQRLFAEVEDDVEVEPVGEFNLKGFQRPVAAFNVIAIRDPTTELPSGLDIGHGDGAEPAQPLRAAEP
jgi:hypothetical protein